MCDATQPTQPTPNHEDNLMDKFTQLMNALDDFGYRELTEAVMHDLTDKDGNTIPAGAGNWCKDDLNAVYAYLDEDLVALRNTGADLTDIYRAKERIAQAFILDALPDVADAFKYAHEDWFMQLEDSKNAVFLDLEKDPTENQWYETELAEPFLKDLLAELEHRYDENEAELEHRYDENEAEQYAEFARNAMISYLNDGRRT